MSAGSTECLLGIQGACWEHGVPTGSTGCLLGARSACWEHRVSAERMRCLLRAVHSVKSVLYLTCWAEKMFRGFHVNPEILIYL